MRAVWLALGLAACASAPPERGPLDVEALIADAPAYVASRYEPRELPDALVRDLETALFRCEPRGQATECAMTRHAFGSCFDVSMVRVSATAPVRAERNRRCMGVRPG
ncbi:MAG: hypothetical protein J0L81_13345 [Caulobacterales bacterium]|jgi:hypothetical protein|nr:hypothetical protein [Caulobacterales bacterium]